MSEASPSLSELATTIARGIENLETDLRQAPPNHERHAHLTPDRVQTHLEWLVRYAHDLARIAEATERELVTLRTRVHECDQEPGRTRQHADAVPGNTLQVGELQREKLDAERQARELRAQLRLLAALADLRCGATGHVRTNAYTQPLPVFIDDLPSDEPLPAPARSAARHLAPSTLTGHATAPEHNDTP